MFSQRTLLFFRVGLHFLANTLCHSSFMLNSVFKRFSNVVFEISLHLSNNPSNSPWKVLVACDKRRRDTPSWRIVSFTVLCNRTGSWDKLPSLFRDDWSRPTLSAGMTRVAMYLLITTKGNSSELLYSETISPFRSNLLKELELNHNPSASLL